MFDCNSATYPSHPAPHAPLWYEERKATDFKFSARTPEDCLYLFFPATATGFDLVAESKLNKKNFSQKPPSQDVATQLNRLILNLNLSKTSIAEIMGVSRQIVYDWINGQSPNSENYKKIEWLISLELNLSEYSKSRLWLWKDKKLKSGLSLTQTLKEAKSLPNELAQEINSTLDEWQAASSNEGIIKENFKKISRNKSAAFSYDS